MRLSDRDPPAPRARHNATNRDGFGGHTGGVLRWASQAGAQAFEKVHE